MTARFDYDTSRQPPAPVLPVRVGGPGQAPAVLLGFLVDSSADISVVPEAVVRDLRLPAVGQITVRGVGSSSRRATVYVAEIEAAGVRRIVEVLGLGEEALIGRDVLNEWTTVLRGPGRILEISTRSRSDAAGR